MNAGKIYLSPKNDLIFKLIFGSQKNIEILIGFLQSVLDLPANEYDHIELVNTHLQPEMIGDKEGILDIKLHTKNKNIIDIEIQVKTVPDMRERVVFYASKMITEQIKRGEIYNKIKRAISIVITNFRLINDSESYHNRYRLYDKKTGSQFTDVIEICILELIKLPEENDESDLWDWLKFINSESEEECKVIADRNPQIKKAVRIVTEMSMDDSLRYRMESLEKAEHDEISRLKGAKKDGIKVGRELGFRAGEIKKTREIARNLKKKDLPSETIAAVTGLSQKEIESLIQQT